MINCTKYAFAISPAHTGHPRIVFALPKGRAAARMLDLIYAFLDLPWFVHAAILLALPPLLLLVVRAIPCL